MPEPSEMVKLNVSKGETCFWCERSIDKEERCVSVTFEIKIIFKVGAKTEFAHKRCAEEAGERLIEVSREIE